MCGLVSWLFPCCGLLTCSMVKRVSSVLGVSPCPAAHKNASTNSTRRVLFLKPSLHLEKLECPSCFFCGHLHLPARFCRNRNCNADIHGIKSSTAGLRFHDLRHHAITELAESRASDQTIMAIAGHVSQRMLSHYSHVRLDAKRNALDALSNCHSEPLPFVGSGSNDAEHERLGYGTKDDTNRAEQQSESAEVIERNGRPEWIRTIDLFRVKEAL